MSMQSIRQSELFAGNDWTVIYKAFTDINLNAFDFNSIRSAMVTYINDNYPEMINDWLNSSEYVALIDIISYLGESLAFRMDLNARENFLELATRRESILRMARFLSYRPKRNLCANGKLKLTGIMSSDDIYDSLGTNLNGTKINWNDTSNSNWYEQFITVLNASLISTNPFGTYLDVKTIGGIETQLYRFNNIITSSGVFSFSQTINGTTVPFEIVGTEFTTSGTALQEVEPDLVTPFQVIYMNDGNGNSSSDTGFFAMFKQGELGTFTTNISAPIENNTISISEKDVNDSDVWVQTVDDNGYIVSDGKWTRVGYVPTVDATKVILTSDNITYNGVSSDIRNLYQDITQINDQVTLRFGDGRFSSIPTGNIRVWYRTSLNDTLTIKPSDIDDISVTTQYTNKVGNLKTLTLYFSLEETVNNGSPSETNDQIRQRVGAVYSTQGRMVSGNDYNVLPTSNQEVLKTKAINRMYSGQSRYLDLNDPTGTYQSVNVFGDDGAFYKQYQDSYAEISNSLSITSNHIVTEYIESNIENNSLANFIYDYYITNLSTLSSTIYNVSVTGVTWLQPSASSGQSTYTGFFSVASNSSLTLNNIDVTTYCGQGMFIGYYDSGNLIWSQCMSYDSTMELNNIWLTEDDAGPLTMDRIIPNGATISYIIPALKTTLTNDEITTLADLFSTKKKQTFGIGFDIKAGSIYIIPFARLSDGDFDMTTKGLLNDTSWLIKCEYSPLSWRIYSRNLQYVFESEDDTKFFYVNTYKILNRVTGEVGYDQIKILKYNFPKNNGIIDSDTYVDIYDNFSYYDGYVEPRRVIVSNSSQGSVSPSYFSNILSLASGNYVFHQQETDENGYLYWKLRTDITVGTENDATNNTTGTTYVASGTNGLSGTFYLNGVIDTTNSYQVNTGVYNLSFMWKHLSPNDNRIDPAVSNVIDIYALTTGYYDDMVTWRTNGLVPDDEPIAPTQIDLEQTFSDLENYKMFSDTIVWKPAEFLLIGGQNSASQHKFTLKIVTLPGTTLSDGQIKSNCVQAVNTYFDVNSWDFGENFYASELIAFLHQELINSISSVVLVPTSTDQAFGDLFEIDAGSNQLFFSTLTVDDIIVVPALTSSALRIGNGS